MQVEDIGPGRAYRTRLLTPADFPSLQALFERAADYFEIATGLPPGRDEAQRAFVGGPPSKSVNDKKTIGVIDREGSLVGVLDAIPDWPADGVWTMGMLLLDPAVRRRGLGHAVLEAYETWARGEGARSYRTAVVAHHQPGIDFLERQGFKKETTLADYHAGGRKATVLFFTKGS